MDVLLAAPDDEKNVLRRERTYSSLDTPCCAPTIRPILATLPFRGNKISEELILNDPKQLSMTIRAPLYLLKHIEVRLQLADTNESILMSLSEGDIVHEFVNDEILCCLETRLEDALDRESA